MEDQSESPRRLLFRAHLKPHRSLSQRDFRSIRCTTRHLAQRETTQQPGLVWRVAQRFGKHCSSFICAMQIQQEIAQIPQSRDQRRVKPQRSAVGGFGFRRVPARAQHHAEIRQDSGIRRGSSRALQQ